MIKLKFLSKHYDQSGARTFFLLDSYGEHGWFYIISKKDFLVTDDLEIQIGTKVQFVFREENKIPKLRNGKIIFESGNSLHILKNVKIFLNS